MKISVQRILSYSTFPISLRSFRRSRASPITSDNYWVLTPVPRTITGDVCSCKRQPILTNGVSRVHRQNYEFFSALLGRHDAMFESILNELGSGAQTERLHQTVAMEFDGSRRHMQDFRDFLVIPSLGGEL